MLCYLKTEHFCAGLRHIEAPRLHRVPGVLQSRAVVRCPLRLIAKQCVEYFLEASLLSGRFQDLYRFL